MAEGTLRPANYQVVASAGPIAIAVTLAYCILATNLDIFLSERGLFPFSAYFIFVALAVLFVTAIAVEGTVRTSFERFEGAVRFCIVPLTIFSGWVAIHAFHSGGMPLSGDVDFTIVLPVLQFAVLLFGIALASEATVTVTVRKMSALVVLLLSASVILETFLPTVLGASMGRKGGLALDSNTAAFLIAASLALSVDFRRTRLLDIGVIIIAVAGVVCTLSRMGILFLLIVFATYGALFALRELRERRLDRLVLGAAVAIAALGASVAILYVLTTLPQVQNTTIVERAEQLLFSGARNLEDPYRSLLFNHYLDIAARSPFAGNGAGHTLTNLEANAPFGFGPHNMYLRAWIDVGLVGLFIYVAFVFSVIALGVGTRSPELILVGCLLGLYGFFSHNVIDNKAVVILVAVAMGQAAVLREGKS